MRISRCPFSLVRGGAACRNGGSPGHCRFYGLCLLTVQVGQLVDSFQEPIREPLFFFTEPDFRDMRPSILWRCTQL
jgi:hypothetical protein